MTFHGTQLKFFTNSQGKSYGVNLTDVIHYKSLM